MKRTIIFIAVFSIGSLIGFFLNAFVTLLTPYKVNLAKSSPKESPTILNSPETTVIKASPDPIRMNTIKSAVIVVDMQNAFASKGGMIDKLGLFSDRNREIIEPIQKLLKVARTAGIKIIYLRMVYRSDQSNAGGIESPNFWKETGIVAMREKPEFKGKFITEGTWDSEIIDELKPLPGDIVVTKSRYSGFVNTELQTILQTYNIKYLIFVGLATNVCVESTIRDAFFHEYFPILVSDCVAPVGPDYLQDATIFNVKNFFGWVTTSEDLIKSILETGKK
jgi:ureidoacrylate peracid hydrolase